MITLAAPVPLLTRLRRDLWHERLESVAILLGTPVPLSGGSHHPQDWRVILREVHVAPAEAYEERTAQSVRVSPAFGLPIEKKARQTRGSLIYCHTHPLQRGVPHFSPIDDRTEAALAAYAEARSPGVPHLSLLLGIDGLSARVLGHQEGVRVLEIGEDIRFEFDPRVIAAAAAHDRQILVFGAEGQRRVSSVRVAIVGLGGTGSHVAQQLAHLGVADFILVDRDRIETTNLNRTVGATEADVGEPKTAIAERQIRAINPRAQIESRRADIVDEGEARSVARADFIFCCTDSLASRHVLNQLAYQYLVPVIDVGVAIDPTRPPYFAGHVKALAPGLSCLWCLGNLDARALREEMMTPEQRRQDPYFASGTGGPQPAVISLNGTIASLAVTMFLSMVAGVPSPPRYLVYDGHRARVSAVTAAPDPACNFCSETSTAFGGDAFPLPERRRASR